MSDLDRDMMTLDGELRDLIEADDSADVASSHERVAIRRRVLVSVGLAIGGAGGLGGIGGASAAGTGAAGGGIGAAGGGVGAATAPVAGGFTAGKIVATTIAVTVGAGSATVAVRELRGEPPARVAAAPPMSREPTTPDAVRVAPHAPVASPPTAASPTAASSVVPAPATPATQRAAPRLARPTSPPASPSSAGIAPAPRIEAELLGDISRALVAGNSERALTLVAEHEHTYPDGALAEEREALRIDALLAAGRTREAHERASRFRARFRGSLHTARIDRALTSRKVTP